jgi:excinuclease ABC subunit C
MTGRVVTSDAARAGELRHVAVTLHLEDGRAVLYDDARRFGDLDLRDADGWLERDAQLGVEPLSDAFTAERLHELTRTSITPIRNWLLDQRRVAGVGNIYAVEALYRAGIRPTRRARTLKRRETELLRATLRDVLQESIDARGTTISDYRDGSGEPGSFNRRLQAYDRAGEACGGAAAPSSGWCCRTGPRSTARLPEMIGRPRPPGRPAGGRSGIVPEPAGIYRMMGPGDEVLYVGKSVRVRSTAALLLPRGPQREGREIISHTHRIDWEYAPNEFAAVLAEMRSIQKTRPPFNVEHKRDRWFCFVKLTREEAPRLYVVREVLDDGAIYFGPFRGPRAYGPSSAKCATCWSCGTARRPRACASPTSSTCSRSRCQTAATRMQPLCLRGDVGKCLAPCAGRCTKHEYRAQVELARRFLDGDADIPLTILRQRMDTAADRLHFEYAAELRDRMNRLEEARAELISLRGLIESLSFVYEVPGHQDGDRAYIIRRGSIREELPAPTSPRERAALYERAARLLERRETFAPVSRRRRRRRSCCWRAGSGCGPRSWTGRGRRRRCGVRSGRLRTAPLL